MKNYQKLGWESLSDRRWYKRSVLFFKVINGLVPIYLSSLLPNMREQRCDLRKTNTIIAPKCRTDAIKTVFPHCIKEWNNLNLEFHKVRPLSHMTRQIHGTHDLYGVRRLTKLRGGFH